MTTSYTYIVTIGVIMLVTFTTAALFLQQVNSVDYAAKRSALSVAASHVLSGIWSAVEEVKLTQSGREFKSVSVGFPFRAEIGSSPRTGDLVVCVTAMGITYERPLPVIQGVQYVPSASGGDRVGVLVEMSGGRASVRLVNVGNDGNLISDNPGLCLR
ncbi:MAG: hypothetical protein NZ733_04415 [Aigarchaeota archaeon]|nr:hypothetical protein [Aigarchaeota archaeon]MCX8202759.1 hypothetical protein [Nitrososphaeria archaeon]MDW8042735.1 hypothetical protein [Nitrososphaerota archaeon]